MRMMNLTTIGAMSGWEGIKMNKENLLEDAFDDIRKYEEDTGKKVSKVANKLRVCLCISISGCLRLRPLYF